MSTATSTPVGDPAALFRLDGQIALVTGASSGLGARFAQVLAAAGARVVLTARRDGRLKEVAEHCPGSLVVPCDVTLAEDRARLVSTVVEHFGRIDILVNNAGSSRVVRAEKEPPADFASLVDINLTSVFALSQLAGERMLAQGSGTIVNIASIYGMVASGTLPQAAYVASKGGVLNLTRELAAQWARRGVRVNAICPGWFRSELTAEMLDTESGRKWINQRTPMGREGTLDELDGALLYLASRASSYVTGIAIPVDGGYVAV
ncbi:SDR family NAD(P)-dependent oxidoreductase [Kitasatospora sp. NBC_00315]|uniref:SDR family NAD(P)-dependent oxidoreductase n=1 Tax=Kitasatospora sp. NBC_00315 TaxID=2975963 RepID=UPI00325179E1